MQLDHSFTVPVGVDPAWAVLLDIERIAPCMPGAAVDSVDGDDFTGTVKVKLGPINLTYKGKASFVEKDEAAHRAVIDARGRDSRGNGTAAAKVTATLTESGAETQVAVRTDLDITGKPAQFGRGVMVDVGNKLIGQFADCLARKLAEGGAAPAPEPGSAPAPASAPGAANQTSSPDELRTDQLPTVGVPAADASATTVELPAAGTSPAKKEPAAKKAPAKKATAKKAPPTKAPAAKAAKKAPAQAPPAQTESAAETAPAPPPAEKASTPSPVTPSPVTASEAEVEPINLLESAGPAVVKRLAPVVAVVALALIVLRLRKRD